MWLTVAAVVLAVAVAVVVVNLAPKRSVEAGDAVVPWRDPAALVVGDSFPAGSGAPSKEKGAGCLAVAVMGWTCNLDAQAGTGFIADGTANDPAYGPLIERLPETKRKHLADIVVIDAGRNDRLFPDEDIAAAITTYLEAVRAAWPKAELVVIEPYFMNSHSPLFSEDVLDHLHAEVERLEGHVISPHDEGWIPRGRKSRDLDAEGHRYIGERLATALQELGLDDLAITDGRISTE